MKLALPLLAASSVGAFAPSASSRSSTALRSDYDAQYQAFSEGNLGIQPIQPGLQEPGYAPIAPYDGVDERNYGFRVYGDMRDGREGQGMPLRSDTDMGKMGMDRYSGYSEEGERVQGNSLRTYGNFGGSNSVDLSTEGRPIHANLEMWAGPDNTAKKVSLYSQDGSKYGIRTTFNSNTYNSVAVRNQGSMEFPLQSRVTSKPYMGTFNDPGAAQQSANGYTRNGRPEGVKIQGEGMVQTFPIAPEVQSVKIILQSEGMPMYGSIELLQGPNNVKLQSDVYDDGIHGPFETIMDTPGISSTLRITNTGPMTYPFHALVVPYTFGEPDYGSNDRNSNSRFGPDGRFLGSF